MVATSRDFRVRTICMSPCQDLAREQHQRTRIWFLWLDQLYPIVLSTLWRIKQGMATSGLFHGPARMGTGDLCGLFQASVWDDDPDCVICFRWVVHSASSDIQIYHIYIYIHIHVYMYIYIYIVKLYYRDISRCNHNIPMISHHHMESPSWATLLLSGSNSTFSLKNMQVNISKGATAPSQHVPN